MRQLKAIGVCALTLALLIGISSCSDSPTEPAESQDRIPHDVMEIARDHSFPFAPVESGISKFTPSSAIYDPPFENYDLYSVTLLWGELFNDLYNTPTPPSTSLDWSGQVSVNGVVVIDVVYEIDFEPGEDSVLTDDTPSQTAWVSQAGDLDGISMLVYYDRDVEYFVAPTFSIGTEQIDLKFNFGELQSHASLHHVSNTQAMVVVAKRIWSADCASGSIIGEWVRDDIGGQTGTFNGIWYKGVDVPAGYFSGEFEKTNSGVGVFTGSVSGYVTDQVIYEFKGTWIYDDPSLCPLCGTGHGRYWGVYSDLNGNIVGVLKGEFGYATTVEDNHLPLQGVWREFCNDVALTNNHY